MTSPARLPCFTQRRPEFLPAPRPFLANSGFRSVLLAGGAAARFGSILSSDPLLMPVHEFWEEHMQIAKTITALGGVFALATLLTAPAGATDIIADWGKAAPPPPPELKDVTVDPSTTALLFLDIMKQGCSARPSCVDKVANMKRLHDQARAKNMVVWYSLVGSGGKATPDDIMDPAIKPRAGEWYRQDRKSVV